MNTLKEVLEDFKLLLHPYALWAFACMGVIALIALIAINY